MKIIFVIIYKYTKKYSYFTLQKLKILFNFLFLKIFFTFNEILYNEYLYNNFFLNKTSF